MRDSYTALHSPRLESHRHLRRVLVWSLLTCVVSFGCGSGTREVDSGVARKPANTGGATVGGATAVVEDCTDGVACFVDAATCTDASARLCTCHGPEGSRFLFCDTAGTAGSAGTGGARTLGSGGSAGLDPNLKIWGGNGGASAPSADVGRPCDDAPPWDATLIPDVRLTVDAGEVVGPWDRYYEVAVAADHANTVRTSYWGRNIQGALKKGHDEAGFRYVRFHGILNGDIGVYNEVDGNPVYDFSRFDEVFDAIKAAGMRPIFEVSFTPPALASLPKKTLHWYNGSYANISIPKDWGRYGDLMAALVFHLEDRYGAEEIRNNWFFEVWNEPSWMYEGGDSGYPTLYENTVKGLLRADPALKVGGPSESSMASGNMISTLVKWSNTKGVKLDFVTYHIYANDGDSTGTPAMMARSRNMLAFHKSMVDNAKQIGWKGPILNTEWGPSFSTHVSRDTEIAASFIAKTIHLIGTEPGYPPPYSFAYWTISDIYEEINTGKMLAYREGNYGLLLRGDMQYPESFDVAKPAFNAFRILHLMGDTRLKTTGGTTEDGVNAQGTMALDGRSLRVLVYNHLDNATGDSSLRQNVGLSVSHLPFSTGPLRVRYYLVDKNHSNSHTTWVGQGRPAQPTREQWTALRDSAELCYYETVAEVSEGNFAINFTQNDFGTGLWVITPAEAP